MYLMWDTTLCCLCVSVSVTPRLTGKVPPRWENGGGKTIYVRRQQWGSSSTYVTALTKVNQQKSTNEVSHGVTRR